MLLVPGGLAAQSALLLLDQNWETPNVPLISTCAPQLDNRGVQLLYGGDVAFQQRYTVEAVLLDDPIYSDPGSRGGHAAIGLLSEVEDDLLAMSFDTGGRPFLNLQFDLAALDVPGCGGPVGVTGPATLRLTLIDDPGGVFILTPGPGPVPGTVLDSFEVTGLEPVPPTPYELDWSTRSVSLDASSSTDGRVVLLLDAIRPNSGSAHYQVVDNLRIGASENSSDLPVEILSFQVE